MTKPILYGLLAFCCCHQLIAGTNDTIINPLTTEQAEMLSAHNAWRQGVGVKPLTWSTPLADSAQRYANQLSQSGCKMQHSKTEFGENLYWASPLTRTYSSGKVSTQAQTVSAKHVTSQWANESGDYDHSSNTCRPGAVCGHYTQIVWRNTTELGCGKALCVDKAQLWVCHYAPAGNFIGQKPY